MKAQKAKMKGNEGVQSQNEENQRPQAQKLENRPGYGADKFFVWDLGKTDRFWQLVGGGPRGRPPQEEMLFNMDHAHGGPPCKEQILICHKKKCYQTWTMARLNVKLQGATLNVPQEEMLLNTDHGQAQLEPPRSKS